VIMKFTETECRRIRNVWKRSGLLRKTGVSSVTNVHFYDLYLNSIYLVVVLAYVKAINVFCK
jgi:hypothetical protein